MVVCTERDKLISSLPERNKPPNSQKIYSLVLAPKEHNISINVTIITNEFTLMKEAFAFARCGRKQSGNIKSAMIPVKYRGKKTSVCLQACLKAIMIIFCNWDLWILPSSHFRFWFTLTMKQQGFFWTRHHKSQGCVMMFELRHRWRYYMWKVLRMLLSVPRERQRSKAFQNTQLCIENNVSEMKKVWHTCPSFIFHITMPLHFIPELW